MSQIDVLFKNLATILLPYSEIISTSAAWLGVFQTLGPGLVLNRIRKNPEGNKIPIFPFMFVTIYSVLSLRYAQILNNDVLFDANIKGFTINAVYLSIYFYLSPADKKKENLVYISSGCALITFIYYYSVNGNPATMPEKYGTILTSVLWSFYAVALLGVYFGYKFKTSSGFGFEMCLGTFLMGLNRTCFNILKNSRFQVFQSLFFTFIHLLQLMTFVLFRKPEAPKKVKTEKVAQKDEKKKKRIKKD